MLLCIVQARMRSSRLPGKVMKEIMGRPTISYLIERLKLSKTIDKIVVATSVNKENDILCEYLQAQAIDVFRGSEEDVLDRFYQTALKYEPTAIVRITADCPLMDYKVIDKVAEYFFESDFDYVSNLHPRKYPHGLDVEIFSFSALQKAWQAAKEKTEREHVTPYIVNAGKFTKGSVVAPKDYSHERWTLDHEEDFILINNVFKCLYKKGDYFDMEDVLQCKKIHPEIFTVNEHLKLY